MKIKLKNVRLAFPNLFKPTAGAAGGEAAYNAAFLIPKDHPQIAEIRNAMKEVAKAKWGEKARTMYDLLEKQDNLALHDGDNKEHLGGYAGNYYVNARNKVRPLVMDRNKDELASDSGKPYSGCYVNVVVEFWAQDNQYGKKINASLGGVQFYADGEAFTGGASATADDFDDIGVGESSGPNADAW